MSSISRLRTRGGFSDATAIEHIWASQGGDAPYDRASFASVGTLETMTDVVSRPFVPGRTILNNPLHILKTTRSASPATGSSRLKKSGFSGIDNTSGSFFRDMDPQLSSIESLVVSDFDQQALITQACTSALANVQKPDVAGLVALAELRETVATLRHPVNGALNWLRRNTKPRKKGRRYNWRADVQDIADQHLTIVFGLMPFINDIQGILKALEEYQTRNPRMTSRGYASAAKSRSASGTIAVGNWGSFWRNVTFKSQATRTYEVRAYQLYEAEVRLADALGMNLSEVPRAAWQVATLSFVADWFVNVGDVISAFTPRAGINYLTSGYTANAVLASEVVYDDITQSNGADGSWSGEFYNGSQSRVSVEKVRVPCSLFDHRGFALKSNMHRDILDTFKITASISLIVQRLRSI